MKVLGRADGPVARWVPWLDAIPMVAALALAGRVALGWWARLTYPFDLEWMEGGMLSHAWRLTHGLPLYPEPGPDWVPFVYPPGYPAVLAALSPVFGLGYPLGRAVSIAGTLLAAAAIATFVTRASGPRASWMVGVVVAGAFLGCWRASGAFYDLVRPDGLSVALVAWCLVAARERSPRAPIVAGALLAVAFVVKHHVAALGFPLVLGLGLRDGPRAAVRFALAAAIPAGLFVAIEDLWTQGRFLQYLVTVPASHPTVWDRVVPGTPGELGQWLLPALVAGAIWLVATMPMAGPVSRVAMTGLPVVLGGIAAVAILQHPDVRGIGMPPKPILAVAAAAIGAGVGAGLANGLAEALAYRRVRTPDGASWWLGWGVTGTVLVVAGLMRGHNGGFMNVLMPMHLALCLGLGLVVVDLRRRLPFPEIVVATQLMLGLQVAWIWVQLDVDEVLPTDADREAHDQVVARLRDCADGPIFSPFASWLPVEVGRPPSPHLITLWDLDHESGPFVADLAGFTRASRAHHWSCVVQGGRQRLGYGVEENYAVDTTFSFDPGQLVMKTGWRVRPTSVLVPKEGP